MKTFLCKENHSISFSGGRTSAYMLYLTIKANGGRLPDNCEVTFANTGMEHPATLQFVEDCSKHWDVPIAWLELGDYFEAGIYEKGVHKGKAIRKATTIQVNFETAARKGEPFARLLEKRSYAPNPVARFCTSELKVRRIRDYLSSVDPEPWIQFIGIRADEPRRVMKMKGKMEEGHERHLPLYDWGVTKHDVGKFWKEQPFDLGLPNHNGVTDLGNCTLCFLKGFKKKLSIVKRNPELADWWIEQEEKLSINAGTGAFFRSDQPCYADMKKMALSQPDLFDDYDDEDVPCFCGD
jgi:3'-phosphoadenosine 5'-phosphosulfate sulfotransferase (PAPS reductase)/FAD synthetase